MDARDIRQSRQMLAVQPLEIGGGGQYNPQQKIILTRHEIALHDFGNLARRFLELVQVRLLLAVQGDVDEDVHGTTRLLLIDQRRVPLDETGFFQGSNPSEAGGFGQADAFGQLTVGDPAVELQGPHDGAIVAIQFHCRALLIVRIFNEIRQFLAQNGYPSPYSAINGFTRTSFCNFLTAGFRNLAAPNPASGATTMKIGVPKEIKIHEYRVGLVPAGVRELVDAGHQVLVQSGAGAGIGFEDSHYQSAGASIAQKAQDIFATADLVVKVKEPQIAECKQLRSGQTLFTYLHLAADREQAEALMASGTTAIAYETVPAPDGSLPLLTPMSEVAGRMSVQVGANSLQKANGGFGVLLGGVPGVAPAKVVVLGGGVSGTHAAEMAVGLRADVTVVDRSVKRLRELSSLFGSQLKTVYSTAHAIEELVRDADLVIGAVLIAGAAAPKLVTRAMVKTMKPGAVLVDIAIDQGGCFEPSRPTTHAEPTYVLDGVIHYAVTNMPGAVPRTSTFALTNATLPYVKALADHGWRQAIANDPGLGRGLNVHAGQLTHEAVASALGLDFRAFRAA